MLKMARIPTATRILLIGLTTNPYTYGDRWHDRRWRSFAEGERARSWSEAPARGRMFAGAAFADRGHRGIGIDVAASRAVLQLHHGVIDYG